MKDFARWLQTEIYRLAGGGTITLPAGEHLLSSPIKVSQECSGIVLQGTGATRIVALPSVGLGPMLYVDRAADIEITGIEFDARDCPATRAVLFASCAGVVIGSCTFLGGVTCLELRTTTDILVEDIIVGGCSNLGAGNGRGLYFTDGANDISVNGVRAYDSELRHLVCLENNVEDAELLDVAAEVGETYTAIDLHGKLEGNAVAGSITANGCAGRVNIGNTDHTDGSHATVINHNGLGAQLVVYANSNLRYENLTNGTVNDQSGGSATIVNMGEPE
jgi:hypothetical protein